MKKFLSLNFLLLTCFSSYAQPNMVPNGNFEAYTTCPNGLSQITYATGWASWTDATIDYFNSCATTGGVDVPSNTFGYQYTASGNGYIGGYQDASSANPYKEYATRPITPLQVGARYEVSISVSLANIYGAMAVDDIGIYFYDAGPTHISTINRVPVVAQVDFSGSGPFVDTQNWIRLVKTFVADSAYDNIVIGSFKDPATVVKQQVGTGNYSYYYFDSVVVRQFDTAYIVFSDTLKCPGDSFGLSYFVPQAGIFGIGNIFTAQLSDASGSFASPANIGTITSATSGVIPCKIPLTITPGTRYRIRIVASTPNYISRSNGRDIYINPLPAKPNFGSNSPICNGDMLYMVDSLAPQGTVSIYGPQGFLSSGLNHSISNAQLSDSGYYYIVDSLNGCTSSDTTFVRIDSVFTPAVTLNVSPGNNIWPYVQVTFSALVNYGLQHTTMQWYKNSNILPGETNAVYTTIAQSELVAGDIVCVKINNTSKCVTIDTASACAQPVQINLNITDDTVDGTTVFPNPNNGKFIIELSGSGEEDISFDIINTMGQVLYKNNITPASGMMRKEIDLGDVPKGVYMLRIKTEAGMLVERLNIN